MGLFELAHEGTLFLDEVSEMSPLLQGRLLRVIEEREIMRIGHDTVIPVDIRIIAATNRDIEDQVSQNKFRKDLFYRLDVLRLNIPPLRERGKDVLILMKHFLRQFDERNNSSSHMLDPQVLPIVLSHHWDGNIRQLRNLCERISVVVSGSVVSAQDILTCLGRVNECVELTGSPQQQDECARIVEALRKTNNNKSEAARILGIDRSTLYRKLRSYALD